MSASRGLSRNPGLDMDLLDRLPHTHPLGKLLRMPLRLIPRDAVVPILSGTARGLRWIAGSGPQSCWLGINEPAKRRVFAAHVAPGDVVYDIGANVGSYTLPASVLVGSHGKVIAFEPLPDNLAYLTRHIALNHLDNVHVIEAAVWSSTGELRFQGTADRVTSHASDVGEITVKAVAIDALVSAGEIPPPDCIKIDVEGAEADVLRGAMSTLSEHRPVILLATHGAERTVECRKLLAELGYGLKPIGAGDDELIAEV
jgi:FkbM family methyltransferase